MKLLFQRIIVLMLLFTYYGSLGQTCINDFEGGANSISSYTIEGITTTNPVTLNHYISCGNDPIDNNDGQVQITNNVFEPYLNSLNVSIGSTFNNSAHAIKINPTEQGFVQNNTSSHRNSITTNSFSIGQNNNLSFKYLHIGHRSADINHNHLNPYFQYRLLDANDNNVVYDEHCYQITSSTCGYSEIADANYEDNIVVYTPHWMCVNIDLSQVPNNTTPVILEFSVSDCNFIGANGEKHFSTAYVDDICWDNCPSGTINIDQNLGEIENCPDTDINITGTFTTVNSYDALSFSLNILDSNNQPINQNTIFGSFSNTNGTFSFNIPISEFGLSPSGNYSIEITMQSGCDANIEDIASANFGTITFNDCVSCPKLGENGNDQVQVAFCANDNTNYDLLNHLDSLGLIDGVTTGGTWSAGNGFFNPFLDPNPGTLTYFFGNCSFRLFITIKNCIVDCEDYTDITLSNPNDNVTGGTTVNYEDYANITANNIISTNATSLYEASESITLTLDFHAQSGSNFIARIRPCDSLLVPQNPSRPIIDNDKVEIDSQLSIYPNPTKSILYIEHSYLKIQSYVMYDIQGRKVKYLNTINNTSHIINVSSFEKGIYILNITLKDNTVITKRLIIE